MLRKNEENALPSVEFYSHEIDCETSYYSSKSALTDSFSSSVKSAIVSSEISYFVTLFFSKISPIANFRI